MANYVNLLDIVYPIGSVYITFSSTNPADVVGGTWEKIKDKFLQSAGDDNKLNATGGTSDRCGLSVVSSKWHAANGPTMNTNHDGTNPFIGEEANDYYKTGNVNVDIATETSKWSHEFNAGVSDSVVLKANPVMYHVHVSWENRPAYITCNMYKRVS